MKLEFTGSTPQGHSPTIVSWRHADQTVCVEFPFPIYAIFSESLAQVVVELFELRKIRFLRLDGTTSEDRPIPELPGYQFRGLNKNNQSKTGVALLFHPVDAAVGNQWRDTEQYELVLTCQGILGKPLGIHR